MVYKVSSAEMGPKYFVDKESTTQYTNELAQKGIQFTVSETDLKVKTRKVYNVYSRRDPEMRDGKEYIILRDFEQFLVKKDAIKQLEKIRAAGYPGFLDTKAASRVVM